MHARSRDGTLKMESTTAEPSGEILLVGTEPRLASHTLPCGLLWHKLPPAAGTGARLLQVRPWPWAFGVPSFQ